MEKETTIWTAEKLILDAHEHRTTDDHPELNEFLANLAQSLGLLLDQLLESFDYEKEKKSHAAYVCRVLATATASITRYSLNEFDDVSDKQWTETKLAVDCHIASIIQWLMEESNHNHVYAHIIMEDFKKEFKEKFVSYRTWYERSVKDYERSVKIMKEKDKV